MDNKMKITDKIICALVTLMIMSFYLFEMNSWGRYVFFAISVLVAILYAVTNNMKFNLRITSFHKYIFMFSLFCLMSAVWSWNSSLAISKGITILSILICFSLIYPYYEKQNNIESLLLSFMFSGYGICIYMIYYYGVDGILGMLSGGVRLGNDFTNANAIGLLAATSCIIQYFFYQQNKYRITAIFVIPAIIALAISQSRKATIMIVIGVIALALTSGSGKKSFKKYFHILFGLILIGVMFYGLAKMDMFSGVMNRFKTLFESMNGTRYEDIRSIYRRLGMQQFYKTPIFGIGMGNSLELLSSLGERRTYLHCNFVEILASGGIIGFIVYYAIYYKIAKNLIKYKRFRISSNLCLVLITLMILMDYGMVTYYDKQQYLYFMCFFLQIDFLKNDAKKSIKVINEERRIS